MNVVYDALQILRKEIIRLASLLPEYEIVMDMQGAGEITGPMLMAEIRGVRKFTSKNALVAFGKTIFLPAKFSPAFFYVIFYIYKFFLNIIFLGLTFICRFA